MMSLKAKEKSLIHLKTLKSFSKTNSEIWGWFITVPTWDGHGFKGGFPLLAGLPYSSNAFLEPRQHSKFWKADPGGKIIWWGNS